jgi:iron complex outermembrane receptor protein
VEIRAERLFLKEEAGMKLSRIDTTILWTKVHRSISDLLSENSSVFIKNHGRGALATASFRGTSPSHTQVSWNGISISSPMAGMVDFSLIPVYVIDELSLSHGSASITDRGGGLGGSIRMENSPDWHRGVRAQYVQGIGSYSTFDELLQASVGGTKLQARLRLYHNYSRNDYTFVNRSIGSIDPVTGTVVHPLDTNNLASYLRYGMVQELYFRPAADHLLTLVYWGQHADRTIPRPTSFEGPDNSNLNNQTDTDHRVVATWKYYTQNFRTMLRTGYAGKNLTFEQQNRIPGLGLRPSVFSVSRQHSLLNTLSAEWDPGPKMSVEGKLDLNYFTVESRDSILQSGYIGQRPEVALFAAVRREFGQWLHLNLMLRQEWVEGRRAPLIPFLGADVRILEDIDLVWRSSISKNYRHPSLNDLYWQPGGNPDLLPEEGFSIETGLKYQASLGPFLLATSLGFYRNHIRNWILWLPSYKGFWEPMNIEEVLARGAELDLNLSGNTGKWSYRLAAQYAYTRSQNLGDREIWGDASYGKQMVYIPLHSGNLFLNLSYGSWHLSYQYNAYSERFTSSSNDPTRRDWLYPYFMNDIGLGVDLPLGPLDLFVEFQVNNLLNESYHSVLYRPMPGRNYTLILKFRL